MLFAAVLALALVSFAPAALGQPVTAKASDEVKSSAEKGKATATAGGTEAKAAPCPEGSQAKAGGTEAKAPCPPKAPPPPPKMLPPTGGVGSASLLGLGAGALLVGGGLLVRRILR